MDGRCEVSPLSDQVISAFATEMIDKKEGGTGDTATLRDPLWVTPVVYPPNRVSDARNEVNAGRITAHFEYEYARELRGAGPRELWTRGWR